MLKIRNYILICKENIIYNYMFCSLVCNQRTFN